MSHPGWTKSTYTVAVFTDDSKRPLVSWLRITGPRAQYLFQMYIQQRDTKRVLMWHGNHIIAGFGRNHV
jgi:hypothetical protein